MIFLEATKFVKNGKMRRFDEKKKIGFDMKSCNPNIRHGIRLDEKKISQGFTKRKKLLVKIESSLKVRLFNFHMVSFLNVFCVYINFSNSISQNVSCKLA